jgi:hypothetical protein
VIRLVSGDRPFIAFSPLITMNDSSDPFRVFLGAILSVVKGEVVEASIFDDGQTLDTINKGAPGPSSSNSVPDSDNGSGGYQDIRIVPLKGKSLDIVQSHVVWPEKGTPH